MADSVSAALKWAGEHPVLTAVVAGVVGYVAAGAVKGKQLAVVEQAGRIALQKEVAKLKRANAKQRRQSRRSIVEDGKLLLVPCIQIHCLPLHTVEPVKCSAGAACLSIIPILHILCERKKSLLKLLAYMRCVMLRNTAGICLIDQITWTCQPLTIGVGDSCSAHKIGSLALVK